MTFFTEELFNFFSPSKEFLKGSIMKKIFYSVPMILLVFSFNKCNTQAGLYDNIINLQNSLPPEIVSASPNQGRTNVDTNIEVIIEFSNDMIVSSVEDSSNIYITNETTFSQVSCSYYYDINSKTVTLTPGSSLDRNTVYMVTLTRGVTNNEGTPLADDFSFEFTTKDSPQVSFIPTNPGGSTSGVDKVFIFIFTEQMNSASGWQVKISQFKIDGSPILPISEFDNSNPEIQWVNNDKSLKVDFTFDSGADRIEISMENFSSASPDSAPLNGINGIQFTDVYYR